MNPATLQTLPSEILFEILKFVPNKNNVSLVSKQLYEAVWRYDVAHYWLILNADHFSPFSDKFSDIMNSTREYRNVDISDRVSTPIDPEYLVKVLQKFGDSLENLKIGKISLLPFITPNLEEQNCLRCLNNLKKLALNTYNRDLLICFCELLPDILQEATINCGDDWKTLEKFLKQQTKLDKLEVISRCESMPRLLLDKNQLKNFYWRPYGPIGFFYNVETILRQTELKHLDISSWVVDDQIFEDVTTKLKRLEKIAFYFDESELTQHGFKCVDKLKNLKEIALHSYSMELSGEFLRPLEQMTNYRLTSLKIIESKLNIDSETIQRLAQNFPNLKKLNVNCSSHDNVMIACMTSFSKLESLRWVCQALGECRDIDMTSFENRKLKELRIGTKYAYSLESLKQLVKNFPNIEKVLVNIDYDAGVPNVALKIRLLKAMVKGWKKLTHLTWRCGGNGLVNDDLDVILDFGHRLKYVEINHFAIRTNEQELREMFAVKFGIVQSQMEKQLLMLSIDHETLNYQIEQESLSDFKM